MRDSGYCSTASSLDADRPLLFGEIDPSSCKDATGSASAHSNNSVCNLILSSSSVFLRFWLSDSTRDAFLDNLDQRDLAKLRLVCHDFSAKTAPRLFSRLSLRFNASSFTRPSRMATLKRIGRHVEQLNLSLPRTQETLLPPLINGHGDEVGFVYAPQHSSNASSAAKYGSGDVGDLLVKQYPPLFHASTNVPAFVRALNSMPNLSHLSISCPTLDVPPACRTTVDYALISLRLSIERASLPRLDTLSFSPIYPAGLFYMQPVHGPGATPASGRRWAQIRHLSIAIESSMVARPLRSDQLKSLHNYLRNFAGYLKSFHFKWRGEKGPSPMSLDSEPGIFDRNMSGHADRSAGTAIRFTALNHLDVQNAEVDASQISAFISEHHRTLEEFNFESIKFRTGDWDEALSPLAKWRRSLKGRTQGQDSMDVPLIFSPMGQDKESPTVNIREAIESHQPDRQGGGRKSTLQKWLAKTSIGRTKSQLRGGPVRSLLRRSIPWT